MPEYRYLKNKDEVNEVLLQEFGDKLKELRKKENISQLIASERCMINRTYYTDLENGKRNPTLEILFRIAFGFNINLNDLLTNVGEELLNYCHFTKIKDIRDFFNF